MRRGQPALLEVGDAREARAVPHEEAGQQQRAAEQPRERERVEQRRQHVVELAARVVVVPRLGEQVVVEAALLEQVGQQQRRRRRRAAAGRRAARRQREARGRIRRRPRLAARSRHVGHRGLAAASPATPRSLRPLSAAAPAPAPAPPAPALGLGGPGHGEQAAEQLVRLLLVRVELDRRARVLQRRAQVARLRQHARQPHVRRQAGVVLGEGGAQRGHRLLVLPDRRARLRQVRAQHAVGRSQLERLVVRVGRERPLPPLGRRLAHRAMSRSGRAPVAVAQREPRRAPQRRRCLDERHLGLRLELREAESLCGPKGERVGERGVRKARARLRRTLAEQRLATAEPVGGGQARGGGAGLGH